jgi:hypothetical protein
MGHAEVLRKMLKMWRLRQVRQMGPLSNLGSG